jgi:hypothetical protein
MAEPVRFPPPEPQTTDAEVMPGATAARRLSLAADRRMEGRAEEAKAPTDSMAADQPVPQGDGESARRGEAQEVGGAVGRASALEAAAWSRRKAERSPSMPLDAPSPRPAATAALRLPERRRAQLPSDSSPPPRLTTSSPAAASCMPPPCTKLRSATTSFPDLPARKVFLSLFPHRLVPALHRKLSAFSIPGFPGITRRPPPQLSQAEPSPTPRVSLPTSLPHFPQTLSLKIPQTSPDRSAPQGHGERSIPQTPVLPPGLA